MSFEFKSEDQLTQRNIPNYIVNLVVNRLLQKELLPGERLPTEQEFAYQLGVGRNSVREALKMLSSLGLVEIKKGIGSFVVTSMPESLVNSFAISLVFDNATNDELYELRYLFEVGLADLVIKKATNQDIGRLIAANERLGEALKNDAENHDLLKELNIDFHRQVIKIARNRYVEKLGVSVYTLYRSSFEKVRKQPNFATKEYRYHQKIIELIKDKDFEGLVLHFQRVTDWLQEVARQGSTGGETETPLPIADQ